MKFPETDDTSDSEKSLDIPVRLAKVENMMTPEQWAKNIDTLKQEKSTYSIIPFAAYYGKGQIDNYTNRISYLATIFENCKDMKDVKKFVMKGLKLIKDIGKN